FIKDNGIYVRDGFLITFQNNIEDGTTFKASLTETFKAANGVRGEYKFNRDELEIAKQSFNVFSIEDISNDDMGMKYPNFDHFYKKSDPGRLLKAHYFTLSARSNAATPMKIVLYCTALECLFSTATTELSHRIAERVAALIGTSNEDKKEIFKFIKK